MKQQQELTCKLQNVDLSHNTGVGQVKTQRRAFVKMKRHTCDVFAAHKYLITIHLWFTCAPWSSCCNLRCLCLPVCVHAVHFHLCIDNSPASGYLYPHPTLTGLSRHFAKGIKQAQTNWKDNCRLLATATSSHHVTQLSLHTSEGMQWDWSVR